MSLKTWRAEFYPTAASKCSKKDAVAHSLRKWQGLTKTNLKKHGLVTDGSAVHDTGLATFYVDDRSCALCSHYYVDYRYVDECEGCPLLAHNGVPCFSQNARGKNLYYAFLQHKDAKPMIRALKAISK